MSNYSVGVQEAILRAFKQIVYPRRGIQLTGLVLCVLLMVINFSWWYLLIIPAGLLLAEFYSMQAKAKWRVWAYENVADIGQLQRSAELAELLMYQSYNKPSDFAGKELNEKLKQLQTRFDTDIGFVDDSSISPKTTIYAKFSAQPIMVFSSEGIKYKNEGLFEWDKILNARVAHITYSRMSGRTGTDVDAGSKDFFRFEYGQQRYEMPLSSLKISDWKLDLLMYIYRGRFSLVNSY